MADALGREGYTLLAKNFRTKMGEIDLILRRKDFLLFVEVKSRATFREEECWLPHWRKKKWRIYGAARCFLRLHPELTAGVDEFGFEVIFVTQGRVVARFAEGRLF